MPQASRQIIQHIVSKYECEFILLKNCLSKKNHLYSLAMRKMQDPLRLLTAEKIFSALSLFKNEQNLSLDFQLQDIYNQLVDPPNPDMGDLAFGCFQLAKQLKKAPPMLAQELKSKIAFENIFTSVEAAGPYLNFKFSLPVLGKNILEKIISGMYFTEKLTENEPRTMIEYSQPNTHKELHVGHMRNLCLGDSLVKILKYANYDIITSTFPGDVGTHVAKCLWYMKYHNQDPIPSEGKGEWLGRLYSLGNLKLEDETGTPKESENREKLTLILKQLEAKSGEFYDLWHTTRDWSIELMKHIYHWADVTFDHWYWESDVDSDSVALIKKLYKEGKLIESQGAIGMDLSDDKLGFCMLLKSDGTGLYASKDVELARRKFENHKIQKSIYIVDMRQALHFKQVFKVLEKLGFEQAKDCFHLQYNFVELPDGAMSSRKGNIVPITQLIHKMQETIKENFLVRHKEEWSEEEIQYTAEQVAKGAIKYGMVKMDTNKKIVFDMDEWLKIDGESGPFIQYSYARISSLCRKFEFDPHTASSIDHSKTKWELLTHQSERHLIQHLSHFNTVVLSCAEGYKPSTLCTYLYEAAKKFNVFYHECPIGTAHDKDLKQARLALSFATGKALKEGLALLGIPAPERM